MAVFLLNVCKFNECGITFPNLTDLIQHIEATHIDYDPKVIEQKEQQQPACLPLSYVLRFITDAARKDQPPTPLSGPSAGGLNVSTNGTVVNGGNALGGNSNGGGGGGGTTVGAATAAELKRKLAIKHHSYSISSSNRSNTPTGSEMDEEEMMMSQSEDSNDSWTTEEFSSEFIMRYGSRHSGGTGPNGTNEKPFACPVPGCKKRYKNVNGIKYHSKNGHKKDGKVRKGFKCHCGKSYKTSHGLKNHSIQVHNTDNIQLTQIPMGGPNGGGGAPSLVNQAIAPPPRSSLSPTGSTCSNTSSTGYNLSSAAAAVAVSAHTANNSSTVQLSPASSISSLSSTSNGAPGSSVTAAGNVAGASPCAASSMKSNYGLITIKGKSNNNILTTQKFVKLLTTTTANGLSPAVGGSGMLVDDNNGPLDMNGGRGANAMLGQGGPPSMAQPSQSLPNLVNLGILTPATSPRNGQMGTGGVVGAAGNNSSSGCSSMSSMSNSSMESLPLTPVSPTIGKSEAFVSVAQELISGSSLTGESDHNMSDNT